VRDSTDQTLQLNDRLRPCFDLVLNARKAELLAA
jgi:hypothetical protein